MLLTFAHQYFRLKGLISEEDGQDLVEYALVVTLLAFGAMASMSALAGGISTLFSAVDSTLTKHA
jgi:pilus assembly protein Flp/PilA